MTSCSDDFPAEGRNVLPMEGHSEDGAHRGLHDLGVIQFHRVGRGNDSVDAEPVRDAEDGAQVARVADAVQSQEKALVRPESP